MMLLYTVPWPPQGIYVKKEITSVADMRGLKWRAYSPATGKIAELIGAQPVTIQAAELSQALATGVSRATCRRARPATTRRPTRSIKYWYDTQAWLPKNGVLVNKAAFDALDKPTQAALLKAGADAEARGWALSKTKNTEYLELLKKNGMTILPPSAQLKADLKKVGGHDAAGVAAEGRPRRPGHRRRLPQAVSAAPAPRAWTRCTTPAPRLPRSSWSACWWRCCCPSSAGNCTSTCPASTATPATDGRHRLPRARPHAQAGRAHPRHAAAQRAARRGRRRLEIWALGAASALAALAAFYCLQARLAVVRVPRHLDRQRRTPLWIPQLSMAAGSVVLAVAFVDELVLEILGRRVVPVSRRGKPQ
jgi:hypothetical protein